MGRSVLPRQQGAELPAPDPGIQHYVSTGRLWRFVEAGRPRGIHIRSGDNRGRRPGRTAI